MTNGRKRMVVAKWSGCWGTTAIWAHLNLTIPSQLLLLMPAIPTVTTINHEKFLQFVFTTSMEMQIKTMVKTSLLVVSTSGYMPLRKQNCGKNKSLAKGRKANRCIFERQFSGFTVTDINKVTNFPPFTLIASTLSGISNVIVSIGSHLVVFLFLVSLAFFCPQIRKQNKGCAYVCVCCEYMFCYKEWSGYSRLKPVCVCVGISTRACIHWATYAITYTTAY